MKSYSEYSEHSVSMVNIDKLTSLIREENKKNPIQYVIETGTYQGTGSTRMIAETFAPEANPPEIITLEANWRNWRKARKNLKKYRFVNPQWGFSVPNQEALEFVRGDYALHHQEEFPDIYIDGGSDPLAFYLKELQGGFGYTPYKLLNRVLKYFEHRDQKTHFQGEDLLRKYLSKYRKQSPLIMLDSSGAIGFLEFNIVREVMGDQEYYLLLDDIFHLKHFRSYDEIQRDPSFKILMLDQEGGWLFAKRN